MSSAQLAEPMQATINFTSPRGSKNALSREFKFAQYQDGQKENISLEPISVPVYDLRPELEQGRSVIEQLDERGFAVAKHTSAISYDEICTPEGVERYKMEVAQIMKDLLGATDVLPWGEMHRKTNAKAAIAESAGDFAKPEDPVPAGRAHVDQDEVQSRTFMNEFGIPYTLEDGNRGMIINLWRPLKGPVEDAPLACCDYRTVDKMKDLGRTIDYFGTHFSIYHSPGQRWYYLKDMMPSEVIFIRCYDTREGKDGSAYFTPHTAFFDKARLDTKQPRESMEVRTVIGFRNV